MTEYMRHEVGVPLCAKEVAEIAAEIYEHVKAGDLDIDELVTALSCAVSDLRRGLEALRELRR